MVQIFFIARKSSTFAPNAAAYLCSQILPYHLANSYEDVFGQENTLRTKDHSVPPQMLVTAPGWKVS